MMNNELDRFEHLKSKMTISTFKSILERLDENNCYSLFIAQLVLESEKHIRNRSEKSRRRTKCPSIISDFHSHYLNKYTQATLKNHSYFAAHFVNFLTMQFPEVVPLSTVQDGKKIKTYMVAAYQEHLMHRMKLNQLQKSSVNRYLKSMMLFVRMVNIQ